MVLFSPSFILGFISHFFGGLLLILLCFRLNLVNSVRKWLADNPAALRRESGHQTLLLQPQEVMFWIKQSFHCSEHLVVTPVSAGSFSMKTPAQLIYQATR